MGNFHLYKQFFIGLHFADWFDAYFELDLDISESVDTY